MNSNEFMREIVVPALLAHSNVSRVREWGIFRKGWTVYTVEGDSFYLTPEKINLSAYNVERVADDDEPQPYELK